MDNGHPPSSYGLVPEDKGKQLVLPSEMVSRGLELAIRVERQYDVERYKKPILKFPGLLNRSCINFSRNGEFAAITSHGKQKDNPGLIVWNMVNRVLSIFPEAGFQAAPPSHFFIERIPSDEEMGVTKESSPISDIRISVTQNRYKPIGDPASKPRDIVCVALSKYADLVLIGYGDGSIGYCDITDGTISDIRVIGKNPYGRPIGAITISPDSHLFAESVEHTVRVWEARSGREIQRSEGYNPYYNQLSFSDDGTKLLVANGVCKNGRRSCPTILDISGSKPPVICCANRIMSASAVSISPDNQVLVSLDEGTITVWDATSGEEIIHWKHTTADVHDVVEEKRISKDLTMRTKNPIIWGLSSVAISPDGKRVLSGGGDNYMRLWTVKGQELWEYPHDSRVVKVAFHPNGHQALAGCWNGSVYVWELP